MRLQGKTALITGSTRGIGRAIAEAYAREGATVLLHGRDATEGNRVARATRGTFLQADLSDESHVASLATRALELAPTLDILVNNAGVELIMPFERLDLAKLDLMYRVNVRAAAQLTHALLPALKRSGRASVINVTSIHQSVPYPHNAGYSLTKAALDMLTRTLALELAPAGIRVNNFAPGAVETDINRDVVERMRDDFRQWIPLGRVAQTREVEGPAIFLASDESAYVTGATLLADGGYSQNLVRYRP